GISDYSVTINGAADGKLSSETDNTLEISRNGNDPCTLTIAADKVVKAEPVLSLVVNDGYTLDENGYYRDGEGFFAFTQTMETEAVKARLQSVLVQYPNHSVTVAVTAATLTFVNGTGLNTDEAHEAEITVSVEVDGEQIEQQCSLKFRKLEPYALAIVDGAWSKPTGLTSSTKLTSADDLATAFNFTDTTIGVKNTAGDVMDYKIPTNYLSAQGTLAPTAEYLKNLAGNTANSNYSVSISIGLNDTVMQEPDLVFLLSLSPLVISDLNVEYIPPTGVANILYKGSNASVQYARTAFNYTNFSIQFQFKSILREVPAANYAEYITPTYYTDEEAEYACSEQNVLTTSSKYVQFSYKIPIGKEQYLEGCYYPTFQLQVEQTPISLPALDNFEPSFEKDDSVTLSGFGELAGNNPVKVSVGETVYTPDADGNYVIGFDKGGTFYIDVTFTRGAEGDYAWMLSSTQGTVTNDGQWTVRYTVNVKKAPISLSFTYDKTIQYGNGDSPNLSGKVVGNDVMSYVLGARMNGAFTQENNSEENPQFRLVFEGTDFAGHSYNGYTIPKERGSYTVYAETAETAYYQAGTTATSKISFTITERELAAGSLPTSATYNKTEFDVSSFFNSSSNVFAYTDMADKVLELTFTSASGNNNDKIFHADTYTVKLTVKDANYIFSGNQTSVSQTFVVNAATLSINYDQNGFVFGQSVTVPTATVDHSDWVNLLDPAYKNKTTGDTVYASNSAAWPIGTYTVTFAIDKVNFKDSDVLATDISCADVTKEFEVAPARISKITVTDSGWGTDPDSIGSIGIYDSAITATLDNWGANVLSGNIALLVKDLVTLTVEGQRFAPNGTEAIANLDLATVLNGSDVTLTEAGTYVVTLSLPENYVWNEDGTTDDLVYYGKIDKRQLSGLSFDMYQDGGVEYNGQLRGANEDGAKIVFKREGLDSMENWTQDILTIKSVIGSQYAAERFGTKTAEDVEYILQSSGKIKIKDAGTYKITVGINDVNNYEWLDGFDTSVADKELTYVINRVALQVQQDGWVSNFQPFKSDTEIALPENYLAVYGSDSQHDWIIYRTVYDSKGNVVSRETDAEKIVFPSAGNYSIRIVGIAGKNDDVSYLNYYVPTSGAELNNVTYAFTISSIELDESSFVLNDLKHVNPENISNGYGTYRKYTLSTKYGTVTDFISEFVVVYGTEEFADKNMAKYLEMTIDGKVHDGSVLPVKLDGEGHVTFYTILLKPANNYKWNINGLEEGDEQPAVTCEVTITPLPVNINWSGVMADVAANKYVYTGEAQVIDDASYAIANKQRATDEIFVDFEFTQGAQGNTSAERVDCINAGKYDVIATALRGQDSYNYTVTGGTNLRLCDYKHNTSKDFFTVVKQGIAKPAVPQVITGRYDGSEQTANVAGWKELPATVKATLARFAPAEWYTDGTPTTNIAAISQGHGFDVATGVFTYTHAGWFTLSFSIEDYKNYYWADETSEKDNFDASEAYKFEWKDNGADYYFAKIERETITAPALGVLRAIEQNDTSFESFAKSIFTEGMNLIHGIAYTPVYYQRNGSGGDVDEFKVDREGGVASGKLIRGQYYISLDFASNVGYDFVWQVLPDNPTTGEFLGASSLEGGTPYKTGYTKNGGAQVKLYYAVTASQVEILYTVEKYTFGENGWLSSGSRGSARPENVFSRSIEDTVAESYIEGTEIKFYKIVGDVVSTAEYTDLVNGLPWDAGKYSVGITITFLKEGGNDVYQTWHSSGLELTVEERPVAVSWKSTNLIKLTSDTGATNAALYKAYYNGESPLQYLQASITNMPKKTSNENPSAPELTVKAYSGENEVTAINVNTYKARVTGITGEGAGNFTLDGGTNKESNFQIERAPFTVQITNVAGHVYGESITEVTASDAYKKTDGLGDFYGTDKNNVFLKVMKDSVEYTTNAKTPVGTYDLVLVWKEGNTFIYPADGKLVTPNYEIEVTSATFKVVERNVTVTLNGGNGVYGNSVNLYGLYQATTSNGSGNALVDPDSTVFSLTAARKDGAAIAFPSDSAKWNVGEYLVTGKKINDNYSVTFKFANGGTCVYEITPASIDKSTVTVSSNHVSGLYTGASYALFTGFSAVTVNSELNSAELYFKNADSSSTYFPEWTKYDANVHKLTDVCSYTFYVAVRADNHNDLELTDPSDALTFVISPVTLTVTPSLTIYYGEKSPVGYAGAGTVYGTTLDDLKGTTDVKIRYAVTGFVNPDKIDTIGLGGSFTYTTDYEQGQPVNSYNIYLNVDSLTATNYVFASAVGTLNVQQLPFEVKISDVSTVYRTAYSDVKFETTVTLPEGTYTNSKLTASDLAESVWNEITTGTDYAADGVIELSTDAYANGNTKAVADPPSPYRINGKVRDAFKNSYVATFVGSDGDKGVHTITNASLTVSDITGYVGDYDEKAHFALIVKKDNELTTVFATTADGSAVTVLFYVSQNALTEEQLVDLDWNNDGVLTANPSYVDVTNCYVYYRIAADNHETVYDGEHVEIVTVDNVLATDFAFADADGWTYGLYSANNVNGYDKGGKHAITEPAVKFTRKDGEYNANKLVIKLYFGSVELYEGETFNDVTSLFEKMWSEAKFNAGTYCLNVSMKGTGNYGDLEKAFYFTVKKNVLTVTADTLSVTYGDDVPEYTYAVTGYVDNGSGVETAANVTANGKKVDEFDYFTSAYQTVRENGSVGTYAIYRYVSGVVADGLDSPEFDNYVLDFDETKLLTVNKRTVTVTVEDKENTYNLQGGETAQTLTFKVAEGSLNFLKSDILVDVTAELPETYDNGNQKIIALFTKAFDNDNTSILTNNVIYNNGVIGGYPIYAQYLDDVDGNSWNGNYEIEFADCSAHSDKGIGSGNNAGTFTIKQATLDLEDLGVFHQVNGVETSTKDYMYTGANNYYKVKVIGDDTVTVEFSYKKRTDGGNLIDVDNVIDVGSYTAEAKLNTNNYDISGKNTFVFPIIRATITITANETTIQYGSPLNEQSKTDGRFDGFTYSVSSNTVLQSVMNAYVAAKGVTYTSDNYATNTPAGATYCKILPVCASDDNVNVVVEGAQLNIVKRNVTVTIAGAKDGNEFAQTSYKGTNAATQAELNELFAANIDRFVTLSDSEKGGTFGQSGDDRTALGIALTLPVTAYLANAEGYVMTPSAANDTNYNVTFADHEAVFAVNKATLTIYANTLGTGNAVDSYSVVYGDGAPVYAYAVAGMQAGEDFAGLLFAARSKNISNEDFTVMCGSKAFAAWDSNVTETYTVAVQNFGDVLANYDLASSTYVTATMNITTRPIVVTTPSSMIYEEANDGSGNAIYNNGVSGRQHDAVLTFRDNSLSAPEIVNQNINSVLYGPKYSLEYKYQGGSFLDAAHKDVAPTKAGSYSVAVTLKADGNYHYAAAESGNNKVNTLNFTVEKKVIKESDLQWDRIFISFDDGAPPYYNTLIGPDGKAVTAADGLFDGIVFSYTSGSQEAGSTSILPGNYGDSGTYYYVNDDGLLCVRLETNGRYTIQFKLKDSALDNYVIDSSHDTYIYASFSATSIQIDITLTIDGWKYDEEANAPVLTVNGNEPANGVTITFARVNSGDVAQFIADNSDAVEKGFDKDTLDETDWQMTHFLSSITFDVGYYVVRAIYTGVHLDNFGVEAVFTTAVYNVFQITPGVIDVPVFATSQNYVFNGQEQSVEIKYDSSLINASYDGHTGILSSGIMIYATAAGNYEVTFRLAKTANYVWAEGANDTDGAVTLTWNIGRDEQENNDVTKYITVGDVVSTFGSEYTVGAPTIKTGYTGVVTVMFATRQLSESKPAANAEWSTDKPVNADYYWIKATLSDGGNNFTDKIAYAELTINKLRVYATASGTLTYGDVFDGSSDNVKLS
ncbi:MAG: hypothetical protein NC332_02145, partial [Firmicutes bacterium]|nr:hypothetical protein [Bacillota bacterium]